MATWLWTFWLAFCCVLPSSFPFSLTVLHTNDVHSRIAQFNRYGSTCTEAEAKANQCYGGVARLRTQLARIASIDIGHRLLVDAGDQFLGTLYFSLFKGNAARDFMNRLSYEAMTLGNHEFDLGPAVLASFAHGLHFPIVCANLNTTNEPLLRNLTTIVRYVIKEYGGEKVAVTGVVTEDTPFLSNPGSTLSFMDVVPAVQSVVDEVRSRGVNKVILLSHIGYERDKQIAAELDGVDLIVGGHSHTLLGPFDDAEGPYPTQVISKSNQLVCIVQSYWTGKYLGRIDVEWNPVGVVQSCTGTPILLDSSVPQDAEFLNDLQRLYNPQVDRYMNTPLGTATVLLDGNCRKAECNFGDLVADSMLDLVIRSPQRRLASPSGSTSLPRNWFNSLYEQVDQHPIHQRTLSSSSAAIVASGTVSFINGGAIRSSLPAGVISAGALREVLPFPDPLEVFYIRGSVFKDILEHSVSRSGTNETVVDGRFLQVGNCKFLYDPDRPSGSRVFGIVIKPDKSALYEPLNPASWYRVLTSQYLRKGGDGYTMIDVNAFNVTILGYSVGDALEVRLAARSAVGAEVDDRILKYSADPGTGSFITWSPIEIRLLFAFLIFAVLTVVIIKGYKYIKTSQYRREYEKMKGQTAEEFSANVDEDPELQLTSPLRTANGPNAAAGKQLSPSKMASSATSRGGNPAVPKFSLFEDNMDSDMI